MENNFFFFNLDKSQLYLKYFRGELEKNLNITPLFKHSLVAIY